MLSVSANNKPLDTAGVKFNITLKNPLFQNELDSGYVYDINFPETDTNKKHLINYAHRLEGVNPVPSPTIEAFFNGRKLFEGLFIYTGSKNNFRGSIGVGQGNFLWLAKNKFLDEFDYGSKTFADNAAALAYFNSIVDKFYPEVDFALPMTQGYQADCFLPSGTTGYYEKDNLNFWDYAGATYTILSGADNGIIVPQLFIQLILKKIFQTTGYQFNDKFFATHPDFSKLILFNIFNANGGIPDIDGRPGYDSSVLNLIYNQHVPHTLVSELFGGLQNLINVRFFFHHNTKQVLAMDANEIIKSPEYIDITSKVLKGHELEFENNSGFSLSFTPDSVDEFYKLFTDQESYFEKMYGGVVDTLDDLPAKYMGFKYYYVLSEESFYYWDVVFGGWDPIANIFYTKIFMPPNELSIESKLGTLHASGSLTNLAGFGHPAISYREIASSILFYNGLKEYASSGHYFPSSNPLATEERLDYSYNTLFLNRWKTYLDFIMNARIVKFQVLFTAADISSFDISKKYRINGIDYLFQEVKIPVNEKAIGPATVTAYKV